ncbi:hypothetical protein G5I_09361 [Acromyrmex echinatior]|uniref:Uncharacterized protein n=1 Tax=Acromyrmex echinatior TaxID=103372 RepID=F4WU08_ACREC|nr:hypothetical protein G5I_09361 [Acromyrmex echinatior]
MALAQRSMENHGGPLLPFSAGGREERKKNNLANFPSRTRALGQSPCETDVLPHFRVFSRLFALQSRIKGASTFIGLKTVEPRKPHGVWSTNSILSWIIYDLRHSFPDRRKFNPTNPTAVFSPASLRNNDGTLQVHKLPLSYVRLTFDDSRRERGRSSKRHEERPPRNPLVPAQLLRQFSAVVSISSFVISPTKAGMYTLGTSSSNFRLPDGKELTQFFTKTVQHLKKKCADNRNSNQQYFSENEFEKSNFFTWFSRITFQLLAYYVEFMTDSSDCLLYLSRNSHQNIVLEFEIHGEHIGSSTSSSYSSSPSPSSSSSPSPSSSSEEEGGGGHRHAESDRAFGGAGKNPACTSSHHVKSGFISR